MTTRSERDELTAAWADYWTEEAQIWDTSPGGSVLAGVERDAWIAALRQRVPAAASDVVDLGTGTGELAGLLVEMGHRVTAVDFAAGMLAKARAKARSTSAAPMFLLGDAAAPPIPPGTIDVVVNRWVLWTMPDPTQALAAWRRLLRPGGRLVVFDSWWWVEEWRSDPDFRPMPTVGGDRGGHAMPQGLELPLREVASVQEIEQMARRAGFEQVSIDRADAIERAWQRDHSGSIMEGVPLHVLVAAAPDRAAADTLDESR
ncbi:MAG: class I SAM-dependent methyltransferase [Actinomycetota bacterium]